MGIFQGTGQPTQGYGQYSPFQDTEAQATQQALAAPQQAPQTPPQQAQQPPVQQPVASQPPAPLPPTVTQPMAAVQAQATGQLAPQGPINDPAQGTPVPAGPAMGSAGAYRSQLEGFNTQKLDAGHVSPKYVLGKYAQNYNVQDFVKDAAVREKLLADLKNDPSGYFANARLGGSKGDRLFVDGQLDPKFGGYNEFDIVHGAGAGGIGWQWGPQGGPQGQLSSQQLAALQASLTTTPNRQNIGTVPPVGSMGDFVSPAIVQQQMQALQKALQGNAR